MVRAKFQCYAIENVCSGSGYQSTVKFTAATGQGNESWSKWTPSGTLQMAITNPEALKQFELGKFYYLDFTPCEPPKETT